MTWGQFSKVQINENNKLTDISSNNNSRHHQYVIVPYNFWIIIGVIAFLCIVLWMTVAIVTIYLRYRTVKRLHAAKKKNKSPASRTASSPGHNETSINVNPRGNRVKLHTNSSKAREHNIINNQGTPRGMGCSKKESFQRLSKRSLSADDISLTTKQQCILAAYKSSVDLVEHKTAGGSYSCEDTYESEEESYDGVNEETGGGRLKQRRMSADNIQERDTLPMTQDDEEYLDSDDTSNRLMHLDDGSSSKFESIHESDSTHSAESLSDEQKDIKAMPNAVRQFSGYLIAETPLQTQATSMTNNSFTSTSLNSISTNDEHLHNLAYAVLTKK